LITRCHPFICNDDLSKEKKNDNTQAKKKKKIPQLFSEVDKAVDKNAISKALL